VTAARPIIGNKKVGSRPLGFSTGFNDRGSITSGEVKSKLNRCGAAGVVPTFVDPDASHAQTNQMHRARARAQGKQVGTELAVDFPAVADAEDEHNQAVVLNLADEPEIADSILPKFAEFRTAECLADAARITPDGHAFSQELEDALAVLRVQLAEITIRSFREFNDPGHDVSSRL
jgi:hypothetical protein